MISWLALIIALIATYDFNKFTRFFNKRYRSSSAIAETQDLEIDISDAIVDNKGFREFIGIKSLIDDVDPEKWPIADKKKQSELFDNGKIWDKTRFWITYLSSEDAFFLTLNDGHSKLILRNRGSKTYLIQSDLFGTREYGSKSEKVLSVQLLARNIDINKKTYHVLSAGLNEYKRKTKSSKKTLKMTFGDFEKPIYRHLWDFPIGKQYGKRNLKKEDYELLGFQITHTGYDLLPLDFNETDEFGNRQEFSINEYPITLKHSEGQEIGLRT